MAILAGGDAQLVVAADLDTFMGMGGTIDSSRADLILQLVQDECESFVSPLPTSASSVILSAAARAYANPTGAQAQTLGPESTQFGSGGVSLTKSERRKLRRLAGRGGAFTIDPTSADAGTGLAPWDTNVTYLGGIPLLSDHVASLDLP